MRSRKLDSNFPTVYPLRVSNPFNLLVFVGKLANDKHAGTITIEDDKKARKIEHRDYRSVLKHFTRGKIVPFPTRP